MAKNIIFIICILLATINASASVNADCVVARAEAEIGIREVGGNNRGPRVEFYQRTAGSPVGSAWCAAFTKTMFALCGIQTPGANAWVPSWFTKDRVIWHKGKGLTPKPGDVMGLYYSNLGRLGHNGIITNWNADTGIALCVEGNTNSTGSRESSRGDGVERKRRRINQINSISRWL